jgi:hypothetical protein
MGVVVEALSKLSRFAAACRPSSFKAARRAFSASLIWLAISTFGFAGPLEDFKAAAAAVRRGDYATGLQLLQSLAAQGIPGAEYALGTMYFAGKGVSQDYSTALAWYHKAADHGHPVAQYEIGVMFDGGLGVRKDTIEAFKWFRRSAEQGYGTAQVNIGAMYATGDGVSQDIVEAYKWFSLAAEGGGYLDNESNEPVKKDAARRRDIAASRMTSLQLSEAQRRTREWKPHAEPSAVVATTNLVADVAADFVLSTCYEPIDDISRVKSYARLAKWQPLGADEKNVLRPVEAKDFEAWAVEERGQKFVVAVSHGQFRGKPTQVCQVSINVPVDAVLSKIISKIKVGQQISGTVGLQKNEIYQLVQHPTVPNALILVARSKDEGAAFANIGFMGLQ